MNNVENSKKEIERFLTIVAEQQKLAPKYIDVLYSDKVSKLAKRENMDDRVEFALFLFLCYWQLKFFPDERIINKFNEFGLGANVTRWFIPIGIIKDNLLHINLSQKVWLSPFQTYLIVGRHLHFKFLNELLVALNLTALKRKKTEYNIGHNAFYDLFRSMEYYALQSKPFQGDVVEQYLATILTEKRKEYKSTEGMKLSVLKTLQGKGEADILVKLLDNVQVSDIKIPKAEVYTILLPLFRSILMDKNFLDPEINKFMSKVQVAAAISYSRKYNIRLLKKILLHNRTKK